MLAKNTGTMKLLIGTNNRHKVQEIKDILFEYDLVTPSELNLDFDVEEDGKTFEENAEKKAIFFCKKSGLITIADDSGLEVECLDNAPGIYSHRYCPKPHATDADRRQFLIENLKDKPHPWRARFYCAAAVAVPGKREVFHVQGICPGEIIDEERGSGGFGYDPIFYVPELGKTLSELSEAEKNRISHRGKAMEKVRGLLENIEEF